MADGGEDGQRPQVDSSDAPSRRLWWLVACVALTMYVVPLALRFPLLDPDEGLHAAIAQEMVERGDYVTPRLQGTAFLDKPVLYFWLQAASLRTLGFHELAVRLPGVACGLLGALTTGLLARRIWGGVVGPVATLVQLTMVAPTAIAQAAVHDVALVPLVNLAMYGWLSAREEPRRARAGGWYAFGGVCLGLAILTKGLIGPALVGVGFVAYLVAARRLRWFDVGGIAGASLLALLVAAPWYWRMHVANPGYLHYFFVERHVQGFATGTQRHGGRPWWYYLPILLGGSLPWTLDFATIALRRFGATGRDALFAAPAGSFARPWLFLIVWFAADLCFLSAASSKLWTYCLPLFSPLSLMIAVLWSDQLRGATGESPRWYRLSITAISTVFGLIVLPGAMVVTGQSFSISFPFVVWSVGLAIAATLPLWRMAWCYGRFGLALTLLLGSATLHTLFILALIVPRVADNASFKTLAEYFNARDEAPRSLVVVDERIGSLMFYLRPELRRTLPPGALRTVFRQDLAAAPERSRGAVVVISNRTWPKLAADSPYREREFEQVGRFRLFRGE